MVKDTTKPAGKIAAASLSAGSSARLGPGFLSGKAIENAMGQAAVDALANGITDADEILKLKLAAREQVKKEHASAVKKTEAEAAKTASGGK